MVVSGKASNLCSCHYLSGTTASNYNTNVYILLFEAFSLKALAFDIFAISKNKKVFSRLLVKLYSSKNNFSPASGRWGQANLPSLLLLWKAQKKEGRKNTMDVKKVLIVTWRYRNPAQDGKERKRSEKKEREWEEGAKKRKKKKRFWSRVAITHNKDRPLLLRTWHWFLLGLFFSFLTPRDWSLFH